MLGYWGIVWQSRLLVSFYNFLPGGRLYPGIPYHPLRLNSIQGDFSLHVETGRCNHNHPPHHQQGNLREDGLQNEFCCRMGIVWLCTSVVLIIKKFYPDLYGSNKSAVLQPKNRKHSVGLRHHWKKLWGESKCQNLPICERGWHFAIEIVLHGVAFFKS